MQVLSVNADQGGGVLTFLNIRWDLMVFLTLKYLLWVACKVECSWNQTSRYTNLASSLKYDFTRAQPSKPEIQCFVAVKCTTRQLQHELEKLRFYPEIELIMLVLWQRVAPFGSSCVLNRMSCTSSFPLKTQNQKNRSARRRNHKGSKGTAVSL